MRERPIRAAVAGLACVLALTLVPSPAGASRQEAGHSSSKAKPTLSCTEMMPKPGEYFLYYPPKRCRSEQKTTGDSSGSACTGNNKYTLFYGDKSEICKTSAKARGVFVVRMDGKQIVGRPGALDATGLATVSIDPDRGSVCYHLAYSKISAPSEAHIHKGDKGKNGPVVVDLFAGRYEYNCVRADPALLNKIVKDPAGYFVNLHTPEFRHGAVRGQLGSAGGIRYS